MHEQRCIGADLTIVLIGVHKSDQRGDEGHQNVQPGELPGVAGMDGVKEALGEDAVHSDREPQPEASLALQVGDQLVDLSVVRKLNDLFRELAA